MAEKNPLILVDGTQYLFRAFHAYNEMRTPLGFPTNAIHGVVSMLRSLVRNYPEATVVVIFDAPGKTFRDDIYPQYKANRPPMDEDMRVQIKPIHEFVKAMGLPMLEIPGVEADDVMGTLARQATENQQPAYIASSDKDLAQLVNEHVSQFDSMANQISDTLLDARGVFEKFEVRPDQIIDYLALMGDKVDNIPGIPGVGKKTAAKWLQEHGDLETVMANADQVKGKVGERLREHMDMLPLSKELATINCHVELEQPLESLNHKDVDVDRLFELFAEYNFRTLKARFEEDLNLTPGTSSSIDDEPVVAVREITNLEQWKACAQQIEDQGEVAIFLMSTDKTILDRNLEVMALSHGDGAVSYLSFIDKGLESGGRGLSAHDALHTLQPIFENESLRLIVHDVKSLRHLLRSYGITLKNEIHDVMLESYVLNSVGHGEHRIKGIAGSILERTIPDRTDLLGTGRNQIELKDVAPEALCKFVANQAAVVHELHNAMRDRLQDTQSLSTIYESLELPLEPYLCGMEQHGAIVSPSVLKQLNDELEVRKQRLLEEAYEHVGYEFNLGSPKQLAEVLYDKLNLESTKNTKTRSGNRSTNEDILKELVHYHPLPQLVLDFRATTKLMNTYIAGLLREINPRTERVHTTFSQANASTGRLASVNPNLQNIPIRTHDGRRVREAFVAPSDHVLMTVDYSQIELRVMAHMTDDPGLTEAFSNQMDVHQATAAEVFATPFDQVDEDQRRSAKAINFGLMYGMSAFGLARELGIPQSQAKRYIDMYFKRYPNVQDYVTLTKENGKANGYVETIYGRRIYLRDINARNPMRRQAAERLAINAPVQGSAADIIKKATIRVGDWLKDANVDVTMILQVHDELVFEVADNDIEAAKTHIPELMRTAAELKVPLEVDVGWATNWSDAHS